MSIWFEDIQIGQIISFGKYFITREESVDFANRYDPQLYHLDDDNAEKNPLFGRLSASGWLTAAIAMRMSVDYWHRVDLKVMGGAGADKLRFLAPVYPGDTLRAEAETLHLRLSRSRPGTGIQNVRTIVYNQNNDQVLSHVMDVLIYCRPAEL